MTQKCDRDCKEIEEVHKSINKIWIVLFGDNGDSGVIGSIKRKISWASFGSIASVIILIVVGGIYRSMDSFANEKNDRMKADAKQQNQIVELKSSVNNIKEQTARIEKTVDALKKSQMTAEEFKKILNETIKK